MKIYDRIKDLRKNHLKMSQAKFGETLGVNRDVINNIELNRLAHPGQKEPLYKLICKEFGVSEIWLRTGEGEMFAPMKRDELITGIIGSAMAEDNNMIKISLRVLSELPAYEQETIKNLILRMAELLQEREEKECVKNFV